MKKTAFILMLGVSAAPAIAIAQDVVLDETCTITFKGRVYSEGPCKVTIVEGKTVTIKGSNPENDVSYLAIVDEGSRTGALMGAGTFPLADGPLNPGTAGATYSWPNGYAIDTALKMDN